MKALEEKHITSATALSKKRTREDREEVGGERGKPDVFDGLHPWTKQSDKLLYVPTLNAYILAITGPLMCVHICHIHIQYRRGWKHICSTHSSIHMHANTQYTQTRMAYSERQKRIKARNKQKVELGQTFDGRQWKSEAEMVMRQGYD